MHKFGKMQLPNSKTVTLVEVDHLVLRLKKPPASVKSHIKQELSQCIALQGEGHLSSVMADIIDYTVMIGWKPLINIALYSLLQEDSDDQLQAQVITRMMPYLTPIDAGIEGHECGYDCFYDLADSLIVVAESILHEVDAYETYSLLSIDEWISDDICIIKAFCPVQ